MKPCFYDAPEKRPTFKQIKVALKVAFNKMMNVASSNSKTTNETKDQPTYYLAVDKDNNQMKSRYKLIKKGNIEEKRRPLIPNIEVIIHNDQNELPTNYACIQDTENCGLNLHVHKLEDTRENSHEVGLMPELKRPKSENIKGFVNYRLFPNLTKVREKKGAPIARSIPYLLNLGDTARAQPFLSNQNLNKSWDTKYDADCRVDQNLMKSRDAKYAFDVQSYPLIFSSKAKRTSSIKSCKSL